MADATILFWIYPYHPSSILAWIGFLSAAPLLAWLNECLGRLFLGNRWAERQCAPVRLTYLFVALIFICATNFFIFGSISFITVAVFGWPGPYFVKWGT
jgi:drug/metabolite transporter (DMT)-like permease